MAAQSFANHKRYVPGYHGVLFGLITVYLVWSVREVIRGPSLEAAMGVVLALILGMLAWYARVFALKVQDRVVVLEERLRLEGLLPDDLRARLGELRAGQLIALRFASDGEVPGLVRRVLTEGIRSRDDIKKLISTWRPDLRRV